MKNRNILNSYFTGIIFWTGQGFYVLTPKFFKNLCFRFLGSVYKALDLQFHGTEE